MTTWPELVVPVVSLRQRDSLADLKRRSSGDSTIEIDTSVVAQGLEITTARIPDGEQVGVKATLSADHRGISARGVITSAWEGECRRCLEIVREDVVIDLDVTFLLDDAFAAHEPGPDEIDAYEFDGETVDLGEVVREELMLALPLSPLCRDGCEGVESDHFSLSDEEDGDSGDADDKPIDPRWAALSELTFDED